MPVLLKGETNSLYPTVDVEALVNEVRERLCLRSRNRLCSSTTTTTNSRRSGPYSCGPRSSVFQRLHKHYSSPESCSSHSKNRPRRSYDVFSCSKKCSCQAVDAQRGVEEPHVLLERLLSEQSLIQEAVRRLQAQTSTQHSSSSTSSSGKLFPFVDEDSCDQFGNETPGYSESEDDSVSQHSVDL